jgi:hypothetical protein
MNDLLEEQPSLSISRGLAVETDNDVCEMVPNKISIEMRDMDNTPPYLLALNI